MPYAFGHEGPHLSNTSDVSGNQNVGIATNGESYVATFSDKSVWLLGNNWGPVKHYCWIDEQNEPRCKKVNTEEVPKRKKRAEL